MERNWEFLVPCACVHVIARNRDKYISKFDSDQANTVLRNHAAWASFLQSEDGKCTGKLSGNRKKHIQSQVKQFIDKCGSEVRLLQRDEIELSESTISAGLIVRAEQRNYGVSRLTPTGKLLKQMGVLEAVRHSTTDADIARVRRSRRGRYPF